MYEAPRDGFVFESTSSFFEEDWMVLGCQRRIMRFEFQHFSARFPRHFIFANFGCLRCGQCCTKDRDVCTGDIERWIGEFRFDILEHVLCYAKNAFCANVSEICKNCSKAGKAIVNRGDSIWCPFLRKAKERPYYECSIHSTKPRDCIGWVCGESLAVAHLSWNDVDDLIYRQGSSPLRTLWREA